MPNETSVIRYVITKIDRDGDRVLADAAQGRNTYATPEEAQKQLDARLKNNSRKLLESVYGNPDLLEVRPCECWPNHFDPKSWYIEATSADATSGGTEK